MFKRRQARPRLRRMDRLFWKALSAMAWLDRRPDRRETGDLGVRGIAPGSGCFGEYGPGFVLLLHVTL